MPPYRYIVDIETHPNILLGSFIQTTSYTDKEVEEIKRKAVEDFKEQYGIVLIQETTVKAVITK